MNKILHKDYINPGKVFENVYFVGIRSASTHIIDTTDGLILIDPGYPETLWIVLDNIKELGFNPMDIRIILMSHGHIDHAGAAKELARLTGAKTYIGKEDYQMAIGKEMSSYARSSQERERIAFSPDTLLSDRDIVSLGNTNVLCLETPGHTKGTLSFFFDIIKNGKVYRAGMHGGVGTNTLTKSFLEKYNHPFENRKIFLQSLEYASTQNVDIFLGNHVENNNTEEKLMRVANGDEFAFYAPHEWHEFLNRIKNKLNTLVKEENSMENTLSLVLKEKMIIIVRGVEREKLIPFAKAVYNGGARIIECTFDPTGAASDDEIAENIKLLAEHFGDKMLIGAGTVLTEKQVELTKKAGGKFIISPDTNPQVITKTKKEKLVSIPGALTPSEAIAAHNAGADFVKLFPIGRMGSGYIKDVKAPLSHIKFLAVGGVNAENIAEYLKNGASGVGIGSDIANKKLIAENKFEEIENTTRKYIEAIKSV
ncbi:MAG: MBL fold metallo-hydrolase [Clostridiales bacterium]|nr:MBL fold metallo-hydrolase [Clostridiales bacterium]